MSKDPNKKICPNCSKESNIDAFVCSFCHTRFDSNFLKDPIIVENSTTKKCPYCAEEIKSEAIFCKHCHQNLNKGISFNFKNIEPKVITLICLILIVISCFLPWIQLGALTMISSRGIDINILGPAIFLICLLSLYINIQDLLHKTNKWLFLYTITGITTLTVTCKVLYYTYTTIESLKTDKPFLIDFSNTNFIHFIGSGLLISLIVSIVLIVLSIRMQYSSLYTDCKSLFLAYLYSFCAGILCVISDYEFEGYGLIIWGVFFALLLISVIIYYFPKDHSNFSSQTNKILYNLPILLLIPSLILAFDNKQNSFLGKFLLFFNNLDPIDWFLIICILIIIIVSILGIVYSQRLKTHIVFKHLKILSILSLILLFVAVLYITALDNYRYLLSKGDLYILTNKPELAIPLLKMCYKARPEDIKVLHKLGVFYLKENQTVEAENYFSQIQMIDSDYKIPEYAELYYKKGIKYHEDIDYNLAIESLKEAIEINPDSKYYNYLGTLYSEIAMFDEAINSFEHALDIEPYNDEYDAGLYTAKVELELITKSKIDSSPVKHNNKKVKVLCYVQYGLLGCWNKPQMVPVSDLEFSEGLTAVCTKNQNLQNVKCGYINKQGEYVIEPNFEFANNFSEGLAAIEIDNKWGFINKTGKIVIKPQYKSLSEFSEGLASVCLNNCSDSKKGKWGYIDKTGKMVIKPQFDTTTSFSDGLATICIGPCGYLPPEGGYKNDGYWGFIDKTGKIVIEPQFMYAQNFIEGLAIVSNNFTVGSISLDGSMGAIDKSGDFVIQPKFTRIYPFSEGLAAVCLGNCEMQTGCPGAKWGFIDKSGNYVIKPQFNSVHSFSGGKAYYRMNKNKWFLGEDGYIDKTGKKIEKNIHNGTKQICI